MILVAPTAYKGTVGAAEAAAAMARGARCALPRETVLERPLSDGGPGLLDALLSAGGTLLPPVRVNGPLGQPVVARLLRFQRCVVAESADACGLHLVPESARNPLAADTRGVGELVLALLAAAQSGLELVLGLGGSVTVDGGAGMAQALGWRLLDDSGRELPPGGGALERLARLEPPASPPLAARLIALADVRSPLLGDAGAARVFGPQKGADAAAVARLERGLERLADRLASDLGVDVRALAGGGAAGGLGAGAVAFLGARLEGGSAWVLRATGFERALDAATLLITGEGAYDAQSGLGKVTGEAIAAALVRGVPVLLIAGRIEVDLPRGVTGVRGGDAPLTAERLEAIVAEHAARLQSRAAPR